VTAKVAAAKMESSKLAGKKLPSPTSIEYNLDFDTPDQNPNGIIAKLRGKQQITGANKRSEMCHIFYPCKDTRYMMKTSATLSEDGVCLVVDKPAAPTCMVAEDKTDVFCKQMGIGDQNEKKDWSTWAFGIKSYHKKSSQSTTYFKMHS
jgi:hypothetical protein